MHGIVIENLVVNLISKNYEVALNSNIGNLPKNFTTVNSTCWVIRVDDNNRFGAICDLAPKIINIRIPLIILVAQIVHWCPTSQCR